MAKVKKSKGAETATQAAQEPVKQLTETESAELLQTICERLAQAETSASAHYLAAAPFVARYVSESVGTGDKFDKDFRQACETIDVAIEERGLALLFNSYYLLQLSALIDVVADNAELHLLTPTILRTACKVMVREKGTVRYGLAENVTAEALADLLDVQTTPERLTVKAFSAAVDALKAGKDVQTAATEGADAQRKGKEPAVKIKGILDNVKDADARKQIMRALTTNGALSVGDIIQAIRGIAKARDVAGLQRIGKFVAEALELLKSKGAKSAKSAA